jgi:hypothetical protein
MLAWAYLDTSVVDSARNETKFGRAATRATSAAVGACLAAVTRAIRACRRIAFTSMVSSGEKVLKKVLGLLLFDSTAFGFAMWTCLKRIPDRVDAIYHFSGIVEIVNSAP